MVKLIEDGHVEVLMLTVMVLVPEGLGECLNNAYFSVCPSPIFVDIRKSNGLNISCHKGSFSSFTIMQLGVLELSGFMATAGLSPGQPPETYQRSPSRMTYRPKGRFTVTAEGSSLSLNLEAITLSEVYDTWICVVRNISSTKAISRSHAVKIEPRAHPGNISLEVIPDKDFYNVSEIVELQCGANTALNDDRDFHAQFRFEYFHQDKWLSLDVANHSLVSFIHFVKSEIRLPFIHNPYGIGLKVWAFTGCKGRFRCYTIYGSKAFDEEAAEEVIAVPADQCLPSAAQEDNATAFVVGIVVNLLLAACITIFILIRRKKTTPVQRSQEVSEAHTADAAAAAAPHPAGAASIKTEEETKKTVPTLQPAEESTITESPIEQSESSLSSSSSLHLE